ncbi:hypothetical protein M5689_016967 [Euphorbia peplus]|nr:hypothetical protein M5689_016967 [Euphorbia peplus]
MKKERGKAVEIYSNNDLFQDYNYSQSSDLPCKKHPSASSVGICAFCLKDRLLKLVCSDCGEQRLSSCSCSDEISSNSNRNSCSVEVGSVGRVSFLIENDNQKAEFVNSKPLKSDHKAQEDVFLLKRSSSSCVEIKRKSNGFWKIGKLFRKKQEKGNSEQRNSVNGIEERSDLWVVDYMGVSRSRSLCSFRNGGWSEDGTFSGARSSISAARSSVTAARNSLGLFDPDRKSGFSETTITEPRKSGFDTTDSGFIDLKFDFPTSESKSEMQTLYANSAFGSMRGGDFLVGGDQNGGSCRITVSDRGIKRSRKSFKSWRWIFRHNPSSSSKKDEHGGDLGVKNIAV